MPKKNTPPRASARTPTSEVRSTGLADESAAQDYASSLNRVLESLYLAMADAFTAANITLTPTIYEKILPKQVLILAAHLGLIAAKEDESEDHGVAVGRWFIAAKDRDEILESLDSVIGLVRFDANETPERWQHPTPPECIDRFLDRIGWKPADLIRGLSRKENDRLPHTAEAAWKKFLQRLQEEPETYLEVKRPTKSTRDRIDELRDLMAELASDEFGNLPVAYLWWRPIHSKE